MLQSILGLSNLYYTMGGILIDREEFGIEALLLLLDDYYFSPLL